MGFGLIFQLLSLVSMYKERKNIKQNLVTNKA